MSSSHNKQGFVLARIEASLYLVELHLVREIIPALKLERPRGLAANCCGVVQLRGELVAVFDLARRASARLDLHQLIIVAQAYPQAIGVVVDDVLDLVEAEITCDLPHATRFGERVRSANVNGQVVSVLTPEEVLDVA